MPLIPKKDIIVGARASPLSVCQAENIINLLKRKFPLASFYLKRITTQGDKTKDWQRLDKGIFVKEIEQALLAGEIDMAVHSLKDLPTDSPENLTLGAITKREDPRDILISRRKEKILPLKAKAVVGTSSLRRSAQLLHWRPDLEVKGLRGNLDTRIRKLKEGEFDAIVLSNAGIRRLGYKDLPDCSSWIIPTAIMLPACGQGALGIQIRKNDKIIEKMVKAIDHPETSLCVNCERVFLEEIGGGCRLPVGALAKIKNGRIFLQVVVASLDGKKVIRLKGDSGVRQAGALAKRLAKAVLEQGGKEILESIRD